MYGKTRAPFMGIGLDLVANNRISTLIQQAILLKRINKERKNRKEVFFFHNVKAE
jgi:phosphopantetheinyl transferase (holo-ACP synthase)